MKKREYISFPGFFMEWANFMGWEVPVFHLLVCRWLEEKGPRSVLRIFRGAAKSTIFAVYSAWKLYNDSTYRFIDRGADDDTAQKLTSDTKNVLSKHPLCKGLTRGKLGVKKFSVIGNPDARNYNVTAYGVLSNATGSRADEIVNDDVEVPKNIKTADARQTLRERLAEETHILVPGGNILYIGTPHTYDSIYEEKIKDGFEHLTITLFKYNKRHEADGKTNTFSFDFDVKDPKDFYVMVGRIVLKEDEYTVKGHSVILSETPNPKAVVDLYTGNVWPERFDRQTVTDKRFGCKRQNEWDSQYRLEARPIHDIRLDPDHLVVYDDEPVIRQANGEIALDIGTTRMIDARATWDCSLGKADSDASVLAVMFSDNGGHLYWQDNLILKGEVYDQAKEVCDAVEKYQLPAVTIKTAGIGGFLPAILRKAFKERGILCAVLEEKETTNKANRILSAYETPLSGRFLHVHRNVYEGGLAEQMRDWQPIKTNQPDDILDAGSGCILNTPVRIGKVVKSMVPKELANWQPDVGQHDIVINL